MAIKNDGARTAGESVKVVLNGEIDPRNQVMYRMMYQSGKEVKVKCFLMQSISSLDKLSILNFSTP